MAPNYLHDHKDFPDLLRIIEEQSGILAGLVEKDYWIMHVLYGLKKQNFHFKLKGGTSLSKGYKIIDRFSEDIDIYIQPPAHLNVNTNPKNSTAKGIQSRKDYYDWLAKEIKIDGIVSVDRDHAFDDPKYYRSGGIRLSYKSYTDPIKGIKDGILLEAGFDTVTPNNNLTISSWAFDKAGGMINIEDNRAVDVTCYHSGYTLIEKLQTIATKFRGEQGSGIARQNFMRQYYDVYCLLADPQVLEFIGTEEYQRHKEDRFPNEDFAIPIAENQAFVLSDPQLRDNFQKRYKTTAALYYKAQPEFNAIIARIEEHAKKL